MEVTNQKKRGKDDSAGFPEVTRRLSDFLMEEDEDVSNVDTQKLAAMMKRFVEEITTAQPPTKAVSGTQERRMQELEDKEEEEAEAEEKEEKAGEGKRWQRWPGDNFYRVIVPVLKVGGIVGCKGELIKKLCEDTRARVRILDGPLGTSNRVVLISAKEEPEA